MESRRVSARRPSIRPPLVRSLERRPSLTRVSRRRPSIRRPSVRWPSEWEPSARRPSVWEPSARRPSVWGPSVRRPSVWEPSARRPSVWEPSARRPSVWGPSARRPSVWEPSARRPSVWEPSARRPSVWEPLARRPSAWGPPERRQSVRRPSPEPSDSSSSETHSTHSTEYFGSGEDEESGPSLSTTIKTKIQTEEDGIGIILIQNGPYLQLIGLVEKSAAACDGKLKAGDVLIKVGHVNVLGWTLRELRQLLQGTAVGTILQIQVYRDFLELPSRWAAVMENIPERKGPDLADLSSDDHEESWTSSEGTDEDEDYGVTSSSHQATIHHHAAQVNASPDRAKQGKTVNDHNVHEGPVGTKAPCGLRAAKSVFFLPSCSLQWISRDWHLFERKRHTFTVGSDIGCDIMVHKDLSVEGYTDNLRSHEGLSSGCDTDVSSLSLRCSSPYWTLPKANIPSSLSSSYLSDVFWLEGSAEEVD